MAISSPLDPLHQQAEATFLMYGSGDPASGGAVAVVESFGELEAEYAAIRKGCVLMDLPYRGVAVAKGRERLDFLNRMVTQEMKAFAPFEVRRSFWLTRRGRIDADLRLVHLEEHTLIDCDVLATARAVKGLSDFLFSEEASFEDATARLHRLALHGPTAAALLAAVSTPEAGPGVSTLEPDRACRVKIGGKDVTVFRDDATGDAGFELILATDDVSAVYEQLLERGLADASIRLRTAGWHAFNIARIEAGRPVYNIDFGPESLPHECGEPTLRDRVSFTKGCYLGQEIVARMQSLGHPKQVLVGLKIGEASTSSTEAQAESGTPVLLPVEGAEPKSVGAVTSSTRSPMLGDRGVCFAQVKWEHRAPGTRVALRAGGADLGASVNESLVFWKR
ncbi:MAG: aminomethyltransferase family protein [Planctomycetes bacterium]|nr:aminomethyltransferase family protein [Planctomycetota bacterium]